MSKVKITAQGLAMSLVATHEVGCRPGGGEGPVRILFKGSGCFVEVLYDLLRVFPWVGPAGS